MRGASSPKMRNKERGLHPCRPRSRYLRQRGGKGFDFVGRALHNTSSRLYFSFVISTFFFFCHLDRAEWVERSHKCAFWRKRQAAEISRKATGRRPQVGNLRSIWQGGGSRWQGGVGDVSTTLDMTGRGYARDDKGGVCSEWQGKVK